MAQFSARLQLLQSSFNLGSPLSPANTRVGRCETNETDQECNTVQSGTTRDNRARAHSRKLQHECGNTKESKSSYRKQCRPKWSTKARDCMRLLPRSKEPMRIHKRKGISHGGWPRGFEIGLGYVFRQCRGDPWAMAPFSSVSHHWSQMTGRGVEHALKMMQATS